MRYKFRLQVLSHVSLSVPDPLNTYLLLSLLVPDRFSWYVSFHKKDYEIEQGLGTGRQLLAFVLYLVLIDIDLSRTWSPTWEMSVVILICLHGMLGGLVSVQHVLWDNPNSVQENVWFLEFPASLCTYPLVASCFNYHNVGGRQSGACFVLFFALGINPIGWVDSPVQRKVP